jgi:hypothetical protein
MTRAEMVLVWKTREPVRADSGLAILPTATFAECPQLDLICVPGGGGVNPLLTDADTLDFVRRQAAAARYVPRSALERLSSVPPDCSRDGVQSLTGCRWTSLRLSERSR